MMSTMSASPVKPVMPPPPGVPTPTKVIPSSPSANVSTPGALQNPVPASPPKNSAPTPNNPISTTLPATPLGQNSVTSSKQQIQSQNMNHTAAAQMPLSLITTEHKLAATPPTVQPVPATVQSSTNRTPEKQISHGEGYVKPTSNGVEGQLNATHQPVSLTITPIAPPSATPPAAVSQQPPPISSETAFSDPPAVSCPSNLTFGHAASASISFTPVNPIKTDSVQTLQPTLKQDNPPFNQQTAHSLPSPLNTSSVKPSPVSQTSSPVTARPAATSDKSSSDSASASSPNSGPQHRSETGASPSPVKADSPVVNKAERPTPTDASKAPTSSNVTITPASVPPSQPEKTASGASVSAKPVDPPAPAVGEVSLPAATTTTADSSDQQAVSPPDVSKNSTPAADGNTSKAKPSEQPQTPLVNSVPATASKSELKVATIPRGSKRKRETKTNSTPPVQQTSSAPASSSQQPSESMKGDTSDDRKSKRVRLPTQPYQSPLPEFSLIAKMNKSTPSKAIDDKLIAFYKNEFLAVRNAEGGFYICQAMQNIYKSSPKIRIRWLSQESSTEVYSPDFYDTTDFDCILTNLNLERVEKEKFRLPEIELQRTESILKRALDVEKGVSEKPSVTEEHPDGLDLSLFRDESQLKKTSKKGSSNTATVKGSVKKSSRLSRSTFDKESDENVENAQSDEEKKRKKEPLPTVSKTNKKKKKQSVKKKSQSASKKAVTKSQINVKSLPPKKKKKAPSAAPAPAPTPVEPARSTVKRKRSTSTPPVSSGTTAKRAKKSEGPAQAEEKSSKTRNTATAQTASKNRTSSTTNPTPAEKPGAESAASTGAPTRTGGANNAAGKDSASATAAPATTGKDNRERRATKSRK